MDKLGSFFIIVGVAGISVFTLSLMNDMLELSSQEPRTKLSVQYDCRLAEISPDYPQAVKVKCRQLMAGGGNASK